VLFFSQSARLAVEHLIMSVAFEAVYPEMVTACP